MKTIASFLALALLIFLAVWFFYPLTVSNQDDPSSVYGYLELDKDQSLAYEEVDNADLADTLALINGKSDRMETDNQRAGFNAILKSYEERIRKDPHNIQLILAIADVYYSLSEYKQAIHYYRQALDLDPQNVNTKIALAKSYLNDHDFIHSQQLFTQLNEAEPDNSDVLGGLGRIETLERNWKQAEAYFSKSLKINPNNSSTLYYLAELRIDQKRYDEATDILKKLQTKDPKALWIRQALEQAKSGPILDEGKKLEKNREFDSALELYRRELASDPYNLNLYLALGRLYSRLGDYSKAISALKQGLKVLPNQDPLFIGLAFTYLKKGDLARARILFQFVDHKEEGHPEAKTGLGRIQELEGHIPEAEKLYEEAMELNPLDILPLSYLAQLRLEQKRYDEAIPLLENIHRLDPSATWVLELIEEAEIAPILDRIHQLEKNQEYDQAAHLYLQLVVQYPHNISNYLHFGQFYLHQQLYEEAIRIYQLGLQVNPDSIPLQAALGYAYLAKKEIDRSFDIFKSILEQDPENKDALLGIGRINTVLGNIQASSNIYHQVLEAYPNDMAALSYLSDLDLKEKNYEEAEKLYEAILKINPQAKWAQQGLIRAKFGPLFDEIEALESQGRLDEASAKYQELLRLAPRSEEAYFGLGQLYISEKRYEEAIRLYGRGLDYNPSSSELRIRLGLAYLQIGDLERAYRLFDLVHQKDPENAEAIAGMGRVFALDGNIFQASHLYEEALKMDPNNILALSYYGELAMAQREFWKAEQIYRKILKIDPHAQWAEDALLDAKYAPILFEIKRSEITENFQHAEELYLQLIAEAPNQANYYVKLGQLYVKMKQFDKAIAAYLKGLDIQPNSVDLQMALGFAYLEKGELERGKQILEATLRENSRNAEALAGIGLFYQFSGNPRLAEHLYEEALRIDAHNISALIFLAKLKMDQKQYEGAEKLYQAIHTLDPSAKWVDLAIEDAKHGRLIDQINKLEEAKDYKIAEILWHQLLLEAPFVSDYYLRVGFFYQRILQYEKAIDVFRQGLDIDPRSAALYAGLGLAYLSLKELAPAGENFRRALIFDPQNPDALAGLGYIDFLEGNLAHSEVLIEKALSIDPNRIAALSALGELWMKEKKYPQAVKVYEKLMELRPHEKWVALSLDDARNGFVLDDIQNLIKADKYSEAAQLYSELLEKSPNNPRYYFGLGQMYMRLKEYGKSIEVSLEGLEKNPDENELRVALGYAYFFDDNLSDARQVLEEAVKVDRKNSEALAGLGRVNALENDYCSAESLYRLALSFDPKNLSALSFLADLLMKEKRYTEAQAVFSRLGELLPNAEWIQRAWQDAVDGPVTDLANVYAEREYFELAAGLYCQLVESSPSDPARYLPLGQMYVNLQQYNKGIAIYEQGLAQDPEAWYLWRAIAFAQIFKENFCCARSIFLSLLEYDPNDADSWAGLGRIEALNGSICLAKEYYETALELSPNNLVALSFLADLYQAEHYDFSSLAIYEEMLDINAEANAWSGYCSRPKWLMRGYHNALNLTCPTLSVSGNYHQEDQWDPTVHKWSAEYQVFGGRALVNYPICDKWEMWGSVEDQFFVLRDLLTRTYLYDFDVQRAFIGTKWIYNPCFYIDAVAGLTNYSPYRHSTFRMRHGWIAEPTLTFTYHKPKEKITLSFSSRSDLIARNFNTQVAKVVGYYFIAGTYERKIYKRTWVGIEGDAYWYCDFVHNKSQRALGWLQWRPPCYSDNILFRYHAKYQTFSKNIPDYYTYKPQIVNQLQVTLEKSWRVCWADTLYTSLSYAHGWQNTRTRFAQIIVIAPTTVNPPFKWDNRQYNMVFGNLIYKWNQLQIILNGDYYRDTKKYTIWSVNGEVVWRF
ncbi:tetratricopeptide repeat protein [Candidatus Protochlamydia phocaeensis]|uniref:tetratricopeptide repeat protein n=1 Tax=Candidatus Protochlamydia phocaeensis TaxID=1414722 RepID=UPI0008398224|nr:tetratricopeptide repeat protein [Candidatus Protochlamydia phocaeensis]